MIFLDGWIDDPEAVAAVVSDLQYPEFSMTPIGDSPISELPKEVILNRQTKKAFGIDYLKVENQGKIGSCVGHGGCRAIELTNICEIASGENEEFKYISRSVLYGGSRVNVNGGKSPFRSDGSVGAWAAKFALEFGCLDMGIYGEYDLTHYTESTCRKFGNEGVPKELLPFCAKHKITEATLVKNADSAKVALANGHGISVCSNQGFDKERDKNGICNPKGNWGHCMAIIGYVHISDKLYFLIENSWGDYLGKSNMVSDSNEGTFLAEGGIVNKMLSVGDSFAFAGLSGFAKKELDWTF